MSTDAAVGDMSISLVSGFVGMDCKPVIQPDPFQVNFEALYDNTTGASAAIASVTAVTVTFDDVGGTTLDVVVSPADSGSIGAGANMQVVHMATGTSPLLGDPCALCSANGTVEVIWDLGGVPVALQTGPVAVMCAF